MEANSGTRATMLQVTTNWWRVDLQVEAGGDNGHGKRDHADAEQHDDAADELAEGRDRNDVAIADGGQGRQGPPGGCGNGAELVGLCITLEEIDRRWPRTASASS